jgi:hypothetical protein
MAEALRSTIRTARKKHLCNACLFLFSDKPEGLTFSEYRACVRAKWADFKILPGERYEEVALIDEGRLVTIRHKIDINRICLKYDYYQE